MNSVASTVLSALVGLGLVGCPKQRALSSGSEGAPSASVGVSASPSAAPARAPWRPSITWTRAEGLDALELSRLADAEGAEGLLAGVEEGGAARATALAALPLAEDGEAALGRLCELASLAPPSEVQPLLEAVLGILHRPLTQRERVDPDGARAAARALLGLSQRGDLSEEARAAALSATRLLAERGGAEGR